MLFIRFFACLVVLVDVAAGDLPLGYVCQRAEGLIIDGKLDEEAWQKAAATDEFVDIEGDKKPAPAQRTRVKMLWDDDYFYFGASLEEEHLWATLTERDSIIFKDNDFEIFIDHDGDGHNYAELEINALNTVWDLFLPRPYRAGGPALHAWNIKGLRSEVFLDGTLNDPSDTDRAWTVEIAIPWKAMGLAFGREAHPRPSEEDVWRVNFSRVQWDVRVKGDAYEKIPDRPEHNWVWSPQGVVNMHEPEHWGMVYFSSRGAGEDESFPERVIELESARQRVFEVYRKQAAYFRKHGIYAKSLELLKVEAPEATKHSMSADEHQFLFELRDGSRRLLIDETARLRILE